MKMISNINTPRLTIRPIIQDDAESYFQAEMASVNELMPHWSWAQTDKSVSDIKEFIQCSKEFYEKDLPPEVNFSILAKDTAQFVGMIWLYEINWFVPTFEIYYWLDTREVGKGYMTEAVNALSLACFHFYDAKRVQIKIASDNDKSKSIPERLNFKLECEMENYFFNHVTKKVASGMLYSCCHKEVLPHLNIQIDEYKG